MLFKIKKLSFLSYNLLLILALLFFYTKNNDIEAMVLVGFVICINCVSVSRFYQNINSSANFAFYFTYLLLLSVYALHVYHVILL